VHPVKQIYHCFRMRRGRRRFQVRDGDGEDSVSGSDTGRGRKNAVLRFRKRGSARRKNAAKTSSAVSVEMHREARRFFAQQLNGTPKQGAKAYLLTGDLIPKPWRGFGIGFAPSGGEALLRVMKQKHPEKVLEVSGLFSRDQSERSTTDSPRVMFPIATNREDWWRSAGGLWAMTCRNI